MVEGPQDHIWGSDGGFGTKAHVDLHDLESSKMLLGSLGPKLWLDSSSGDGCRTCFRSILLHPKPKFRRIPDYSITNNIWWKLLFPNILNFTILFTYPCIILSSNVNSLKMRCILIIVYIQIILSWYRLRHFSKVFQLLSHRIRPSGPGVSRAARNRFKGIGFMAGFRGRNIRFANARLLFTSHNFILQFSGDFFKLLLYPVKKSCFFKIKLL